MKNTLIISLTSLILVGLYGCEKVVDFQASAYNPKLVIYGALFADSTPGILLGRTQSYYGWEEYSINKLYVEGANVELVKGQEEIPLELGRFETDFFNIYLGQPSELYPFGFDPGNSISDSSARLYETNVPMQSGNWYTLQAEHEEDNISRDVYIPYRAQNVEVELQVRDTSYSQDFGGGTRREVEESRYELVVSFDINDSEPIWYRALTSTQVWQVGIYVYDPISDTYSYEDDSVLVRSYYPAQFQSGSAGRASQRVYLGSIQTQTYTYSNGVSDTYENQPNFYNLSQEDYEKITNGDSITLPVDVSIMVSHAQDETLQFYFSLFNQLYSQGDPLSEPVIVNIDETEGVGLIGGFAETEAQTYEVKVGI